MSVNQEVAYPYKRSSSVPFTIAYGENDTEPYTSTRTHLELHTSTRISNLGKQKPNVAEPDHYTEQPHKATSTFETADYIPAQTAQCIKRLFLSEKKKNKCLMANPKEQGSHHNLRL